ncbi:MAG: PorP/SprF family type IX secretion system membrane protein [Nitrospinaceae bacterium]|nr:PorP/SprF family type IX secretion system membrane protein [Nitrospinaceae bacterium]
MTENIKYRTYGSNLIMGIRLCVWMMLCGQLSAQDAHLSQFSSSPMYLNASLTGMYSGNYRAYLNYRTQWAAVGSKPWETFAVSYDRPYKRYGFGAFAMNNRAGAGGFNVLNFMLSGAYEITDDPKMYNHMSVGLQLGFIHKYFNPDKYLFDNQYSLANGGGFTNTLPIGETFNNTTVFLPEANIGVSYYNSNKMQKYSPYGGFSLFHITAPKETFLGLEDNRLPRRFLAHGGMKYRVDENWTLDPNFLFMRQKNVNEIHFGVLSYYNWTKANSIRNKYGQTETILISGLAYRNQDAVLIHLGLVHQGIQYRVSYDINTSSLNTVSNYRGGFELSIIYMSPKLRQMPSLEID